MKAADLRQSLSVIRKIFSVAKKMRKISLRKHFNSLCQHNLYLANEKKHGKHWSLPGTQALI